MDFCDPCRGQNGTNMGQAINSPPAFAVVDLRLSDGNGLEVVKEIQKIKKNSKIVAEKPKATEEI